MGPARVRRRLVAAVAAVAGLSVAVPVMAQEAVPSPAHAPTVPGEPAEGPPAASWASGVGVGATGRTRPAQRISHGSTGSRVVYLTFDDGPDPRWTPQVTRVLRKHRVHGTFFVVGSSAARHPAMVSSLRRQGHVVANHSWSHPVLSRASDATVRSQLTRTQRVIGGSRCFRPPYGAVNRRVESVAGSVGLRYSVLWNVDSNDWRRPGARTIANTVVRTTRPGSIVLMHDGGGNRSQTVAALDQSITRLKQKGYRFRVLSQCR